MKLCKYNINGMCYCGKVIGWFCCGKNCEYYEKEDGVINEQTAKS